jgi:hypothetical protein
LPGISPPPVLEDHLPEQSNLGMMGVLAFFMLHLIYGAIVGAMYGPVIHQPVDRGVEATRVGV